MAVVANRTINVPASSPAVYCGRSAPLPVWVPAAGNVAVLSTANGLLTNRLEDITAPWYSKYYSIGAVNGDCGTVDNEFWGLYGCKIIHGQGHATGNGNMVGALEFGYLNCTFKRLTDPAPIFGSGTDALTQARNDGYDEPTYQVSIDGTYGEYVIAGHTAVEPAGVHSYGALDIIPPSLGGAASGTLITIIKSAPGHRGFADNSKGTILAAHALDMPSAAGAPGSYAWRRVTNNTGSAPEGGPSWTQIVPVQNRVYFEGRAAGALGRSAYWFDLAANTYNAGTGSPRANDGDSPYTGVMFHVPTRDLLIFADRKGGNLRIQYAQVGASDTNPNWALASLDTTIPVPAGFSCACWCPDNGQIIVGSTNAAGQTFTYVYHLTIPTTLSGSWVCTRVDFPAGQSMTAPSNVGQIGSPTYKKWTYNSKIKAIAFYNWAVRTSDGVESMEVYRPVGT